MKYIATTEYHSYYNLKKIENVCCKVTDDSGIQISLDFVVSLFSSFFKVYQS